MIPSEFKTLYAPFSKIAEAAIREESSPEVVTSEMPPPHPIKVWAKQLMPIAGGLALGTGIGLGGAGLYSLARGSNGPPIPYGKLALLSGLGGGAITALGTMGSGHRKEELDRAKQEYENYYARRAGSISNPTVQPPEVRS